MKSLTVPMKKSQRGAALAVALMVLLVLTLVAVSAMDGSTLGFKMGANAVYHEEAFNNAESGRNPLGQALVDFAEYGEWDGIIDNVDGDLKTVATDLDLLGDNGGSEDLQIKTGLTTDFEYSQTLSNGKKIEASVAVFKGKTVVNTSGAGSAQYKGYHGAGVGIGGEGGMHKYFEFRSEGTGQSNAEAWTAADFRYVP
ncbi:MAG: hypothetical protein C9356_04310 [Oleiphilus sp.]|nr:MAG: hypothetical protein C9356_04310 [Oleiphilus sp.]